jgi:chromosome segregation ATPase
LQTEKLTSELSKKVQDSLEEEVKVHELTAQLEEEIRKGKESSRDMQQLKQDQAKDREKHDRRIQDVEAEKKQIETAAVNLKNENDKLERELRLMRDSKQEQWQDLEARYQSYIATITELEQEVANQKEIKQKELESNQRVLTEVKRTIKDLERDLQQANRDAEIAVANAEEKEKQLQEAREDHETQLIELDEELKKLKSSNDVLRDAAANHQRMLRMQRQEFDEATKATADHYESRINEVIAAKRNVDNKFKQLQTEMLELSEKHQQDLDAVSAELRDKDDHLREITSDLFAVKEVSVSLTNNFNALVQELKTINEDVSLSEQNLSEQMKLLKQELFSLASENTTLHKRNDNLQEKMEQLVRETRLAEDEASILMTHRDKLDRTCTAQAAQIKQLQDKLKASVDELTKDRDARVLHLQKQELQLRESNELLRSQNQIHLDELEDLRMLKVDLNERNNALADELEDTKRSAHDRINDLNSTITKLNKAIVALKQRADSANSMNESQEKSNNERVQQLEAQVEEWQHKCEEAKKAVELQELQTKHVDNEWKHKFAAINEHIQSIEQAVREQDRRNEEDRHILQKKVQEKSDRIQELEQEMSVRRSGDEHNIRSKLEQMKDLKTQLALSERAKKQMQASLETMQGDNEQVRQRFSQITQETEEVKRERDDLLTQVTMLHDEMDAIRHAHYRHDNSSKDSISHLHDQLAQKDQLVNNLNEQRKTLQQEKAKLATKMEEIALQYRKTIDELKAEIEQTRSTREVSLDGSAKEKRDFDQQITAVRNEVQQLQSERKGLYEQLLAQKQLVEQHKATIRKLEHQFVEAIELRNTIASPVKGSPARASKEELSLASENERLKQELTSLRKGVGNSKLLDHEVALLRQEKTKLTEQLMGQNLKSENLEQQLRQMNRRYEEAERERRLVADTYSHQVNALQRSNTDMHQYVMRTPSPKTPKRR